MLSQVKVTALLIFVYWGLFKWVMNFIKQFFWIWDEIQIFFFYLLMLWNTQADFLMLNLYSGTALEEVIQVQSLVREDPMYLRGTEPTPCNYWAQALEPSSRNYWSPCTLEPMFHNKRSHCDEKPMHRTYRAAPTGHN